MANFYNVKITILRWNKLFKSKSNTSSKLVWRLVHLTKSRWPKINNKMRLSQIRWIKNHVPNKHLMKIVHSLWMLKVRYGLQLWASPRTTELEETNTQMYLMETWIDWRLLKHMYNIMMIIWFIVVLNICNYCSLIL